MAGIPTPEEIEHRYPPHLGGAPLLPLASLVICGIVMLIQVNPSWIGLALAALLLVAILLTLIMTRSGATGAPD